jgi:chromate transporter
MVKKLWLLFFTFAKISALVVGGGLAMLPVIEETFVRKKKLITQEELLDVIALCQMVPGIIAANSAISIGMKIAGLAGAIAALIGAVLPSFLVIVTIAWLFPTLSPDNPYWLGAFAGVRAGVTGLIAVTAWKTAKKTLCGWVEGIAAGAFLIAALWGISPGIIIVAAIILGCSWFFLAYERICKRQKGGGK